MCVCVYFCASSYLLLFLCFFSARFRIVRWKFTALPYRFSTGISNTRHWTIFRYNHSIKYNRSGGQERALGVQSEKSRKSNGECLYALFRCPLSISNHFSVFNLSMCRRVVGSIDVRANRARCMMVNEGGARRPNPSPFIYRVLCSHARSTFNINVINNWVNNGEQFCD